MGLTRIIARNVTWNIAGMVVGMLAGFVVAPFLVRRLGQETYGLWILIASLTGYFGLLDLGVRGSVGRHISFYRARNDHDGVDRTFNTALAILSAIGLITLLGTLVISQLFFQLFEVPADQIQSTRIALLLVGVSLALSFPLNLFDATLWAFQRFDLLNAIDIPTTVLRLLLTFWLIADHDGLVMLGIITLVTTLAPGLAKAVISFRLDRTLRFAPSMIRIADGRKLYAYGVWSFLLEIALMASNQMSVLIIGVWATMAMVTSYSIGSRLVSAATSLLIACTGALTPVATAFEAEQNQQQQRLLFLRGGQCCALFALYFLSVFIFLGQALITLWMGHDIGGASRWLMLLAIGQVLPMSQWVTHGMILAMGRHRFTACVALVECLVASGLAILVVRPYGVAGVCVAFALCAVVSRGLVQIVYGCRLVHMPLRNYLTHALLVPILVALLPIAGLAAASHWLRTEGWLALIGQSAAFTLTYLTMIYLVLARQNTLAAQAARFLSPRALQAWWTKRATIPSGQKTLAPELQGVQRF